MSKGRPTLKDKETSVNSTAVAQDLPPDSWTIPPEVVKEMEAKGLAYKWINAVKLQQAYGHDRRGWVPYKPEVKLTDLSAFSDASGFIRRFDQILAAMPKAAAEVERARIKQRNQALRGINKSDARNLKQEFNKNGLNAKIHEGYDEED